MQRIILKTRLCPGDVLTLTAAVKSLHDTYPGQFVTDVRSPVPAIWENNPLITPIDENASDVRVIDMEYPSIQQSNQRHLSFLSGYTAFLGSQLGKPLTLTTNRPDLHLSETEVGWLNQVAETTPWKGPFWLINAGGKSDFTAKQWPIEYFQDVVDRTQGQIRWVQIGATEHRHQQLSGVVDFLGKTDHRQLIRLAYHARGGLGGVTYLQHLLAAFQKPYVCLLGGREPVPWTSYPQQQTLHTIGALECCRAGACWKSRVVALRDGDKKNESLCEQPIEGLSKPVGRCMTLIKPDHVLQTLNLYAKSV